MILDVPNVVVGKWKLNMSKPIAEVLGKVAEDAAEIWCLCWVKCKQKDVQLKLHSRGNQKKIEASACYKDASGGYTTEREDVSTILDGVKALAKKYYGNR